MTPYLTIDQKYLSSVAVGQDDLFYSLSLLFPLPVYSTSANSNINSDKMIEIKIKDKDMFFDDYIGNTFVNVPVFNA